MIRTATHSMQLPEGNGDTAVPEWVQLVPAGKFSGRDGRGPWSLEDPSHVVTATHASLPLPIDEAHAIDLGAATGQPGPARGWIEQLDVRGGSIWGRVNWTGTGKALLAERAYRGISPTFTHTKDGKVLQLLRAALTNMPNLTQLATLHHQDPENMDLIAQLRQLHGLAADADAAACFNASQADRNAVAAHGTALNAIATAAGVSPGLDATALAAAIGTAMNGASDTAKALTALQAEMTGLRDERKKERAEAFVHGAMKAGKPIAKDMVEHYVTRHAVDPEAVEKEIGAMVSLNAGGIVREPKPGAEGEQDPQQIALNAQRYQDTEKAAGRDVSWPAAVQHVMANPA